METQLQDIIDRIHSEGVKGAEQRAHEIIEHAEKRAQERVASAREQAESIIKDAKEEAAQAQASGEAALRQAARDVLLSVQKRLEALFTELQEQAVGEALTPERVSSIIESMIGTWLKDDGATVDVLVAEGDRDAMEKELKRRLADKLKGGVDVRPIKGISAGFRVGGEGAAYFDVTAETLAELLAAYLNPRLSEIMKQAAAE